MSVESVTSAAIAQTVVTPAHDKAMAAQFLALLDPAAREFTFQFFNDDGRQRHAEVVHGSLDDVWPKVLTLNTPAQGVGVFVTINETDGRGRRRENIVRARALFVDADSAEQLSRCREVIRETGALPTMSVRTSTDRAHLYWCCDDLTLEDFSAYQAALIEKLGTDKVKDLSRVMRLAGTMHLKDPNAPWKVTLKKLSQPQRWIACELVTTLGLPIAAVGNQVAGNSAHRVTPKVSLPPGLGTPANMTPADGERLRRLFGNLLSNDLSARIRTNTDEIRSAVAAIPPKAIAAEPDWVKLARGLAHEARGYPDEAEELWNILDSASRAAPSYDQADNRVRWLRYIDEAFDRDTPITIASVFDLAGQNGWAGWSPAMAPSSSGGGLSTTQAQAVDNAVHYFPGNEQACREALDRVVAADDLVFTLNGGPLVILRVPNESALPKEAVWGGDLPATTLATPADIMERAEKLSWMYRTGSRGEQRWVRRKPPRQFVADYLVQMRSKYRARLLTGISRVPRIDDDGQVHFEAGYDAKTGLYHDQTPAFSLPPAPTHADALKALDTLLAPFQHYKFEDAAAGRALLLGMLFTAIKRPFLPTAPMFAVRASMPGVGKGLLVRATAQLAYNSLPVIATWGHSDEEFAKRLDALLIQSPAMISIDNANSRLLQGDTLEAILSEGVADVRPLGRSETVRVRNCSLIVATGNNLVVTGDMARRTLVIDLLPKSAAPERDIYPFNPAEIVQQQRTALLQAAFTIMRAYRLAKPVQTLPGIGSFELWARWVRDLIEWLFGYDISEGFQQNKEEDPRRQDDAALLAALHTIYGATTFKSSDVHTIYSDVANSKRHIYAPTPTPEQAALHSAIESAIGSKDITAKRIGQWAKRVDGAFIENYKLDVRFNRSSNSNEMTVRRI
jgi:putative DNA primase/helicase